MNFNEVFLSYALNFAWETQTLSLPNPSVGALLLNRDKDLVFIASHCRAGDAHAELEVFKKAFKFYFPDITIPQDPNDAYDFLLQNHNRVFDGFSIFVTLEPCNHRGKTPPCAKLIFEMGVKKVVFGSREPSEQAGGGGEFLREMGVDVEGGVLEKECDKLLYPFLCLKEKNRFNLFKIAQRLNGDYLGGRISTDSFLQFTHNQRGNCNNLVISGNSVLNDNPILDSRFATMKSKNPNVSIFSARARIDENLALFGVKDRGVKVSNSVSDLGIDSGFNLIEGGFGLMEPLAGYVDMFLFVISSTLRKESISTAGFDFGGEILHSCVLGERDNLLWIRPKGV